MALPAATWLSSRHVAPCGVDSEKCMVERDTCAREAATAGLLELVGRDEPKCLQAVRVERRRRRSYWQARAIAARAVGGHLGWRWWHDAQDLCT